MQNNNNGAANTRGRRYARLEVNQAFNHFLQIRNTDTGLLRSYRSALARGGEQFTRVFYDYLLAYPATAAVLEDFERQGGRIETLVQRQLHHLVGLLSGETGDDSARRMAQIGEIHFRHRIEPVWIMGAYLLYLAHLQTVVRTSGEIAAADRGALEDQITRLLFRDMGLMLEGYWNSTIQALDAEHLKVTELQQQITGLLANIPHLLWSVDVVNNRPIYVSPSAHEICAMTIDMPIPCLGWTVPEDREAVELAWRRALAGERVEIETRVLRPDGSERWFRRMFYPYTDDAGRVVRVDGLMEDTTQTRAMIERLNTLATIDSLTGLPNRALFNDRLTLAIAAAGRGEGGHVVLMLMDLDRFKEINDTLGHSAGDEVLVAVAGRLASVLRASDTLARLGGDEFAILLPGAKDSRRTVEKVAAKLLHCFHSPFHFGEHELFLSASIGVASHPEHGDDVSTLLSRADVAMYGSKHRGLPYLFYDTTLDANTGEELQLSAELRGAIARNELVLHYQPKIDLRRGRVTGAEALIRWQHPRLGLLAPDRFLPLAERSGLIRAITDWVLRTAAAQCRDWHGGGRPLTVAVNMPSRAFQDVTLVEHIRELLHQSATPTPCLELEITENALMTDIEAISRLLDQISDMGVRIAIDDFGTGYSSLAYLKKLSLHTLKIDKSFVLDMARNEDDAAIVRSTVDLAHNLGYQVVAEGVESIEAYRLLSNLGCDGVQGYHISHPLPAAEFHRWLTDSSWYGNA